MTMNPNWPHSKKSEEGTVIPATYVTTEPVEFFVGRENDVNWHTLLSYPKTPTSDLSVGIATCPPGTGHLRAHRHKQSEVYHILEGEGKVTINQKSSFVGKGATVYIPSDAEHQIINTGKGDLKWLYVFPTNSFSDVVYRFSETEKAKI